MTREFTPLHRAPAGGEYYVFRDAVHNLIEVDDAEEGVYVRNLLATRELQRLRHIRQNGLNFLVYPSQETSRFPHSLGSFHIARRLSKSLSERQPEGIEGFPTRALGLNERDCFAFSVAALLHDIGHGPLSHTWEEIWAEPRRHRHFHEKIGREILNDPNGDINRILTKSDAISKYPGFGNDVLAFINNTHRLNYLGPLLSGNLDIDRLDFMVRDTRSAGVSYGFHDLEWIIRSLRYALLPAQLAGDGPQWIIAVDARKGLSTLVQFLRAREDMYKLVYHHKTTRSANRMLCLLFERATELARAGEVACASPALLSALKAEELTAAEMLALDDSDLWMSIKNWAQSSPDNILRSLSSGLIYRDLYKVFLLTKNVYEHLSRLDSDEFGRILARRVAARMACGEEEAKYYYTFDHIKFNIVGRPAASPVEDVWIMESGSLGFEFKTLRDFWNSEIKSAMEYDQYLLVVHRNLVEDLAAIVERLSFPAASAERLETLPVAPSPYKVLGALGVEGVWKEVYCGAFTDPGASPELLVALKLYKQPAVAQAAARRDVRTPNQLVEPHRNLAHARLLQNQEGATWIIESLWVASLEDFVKKQGKRTDLDETFDITSQLFAGLAALHNRKLRHTDIKPDNCGIMYEDRRTLKYVLGDFGCLSSTPDEFPSPDDSLLGTLRTRAPEVIEHAQISLASDVWAMGATIYALCTLEYPFVRFDTPHGDVAGRPAREAEIRRNLASLRAQFSTNLREKLPPILFRALEPCFRPFADRPGAATVSKVCEEELRKLRAESAPDKRWAWQQAESIIQLCRLNQVSGGERTERSLSEEMRLLIRDFADYIPPALVSQLQEFSK